MAWCVYKLVFKLRSPLHIGCGKVGNVQRTRSYVTGRAFWGGLTMRLTRDNSEGAATDSRQYQKTGDKVHEFLAYTYFYPATFQNETYKTTWSWEEESLLFRRRFLSSYSSTALVYPQQSAAEGLLHEVEFISPRTLDTGEQVYLIGYVFEKNDCELQWQQAIRRFQLGGERGYGWGMLELIDVTPGDHNLFDGQAVFISSEDRPIIQTERLLAHTSWINLSAIGEVEPLVGREWRSYNSTNRYAGQHVENFCEPCWVPGSTVEQSLDFVIRDFGIWHLSS